MCQIYIVAACCVLHNLCEVHGESFDEQLMEGIDSSTDTSNTTEAGDSGLEHSESL